MKTGQPTPGNLRPAARHPCETMLYVKNMVCDRCVSVVRRELERMGYTVTRIALGEAVIISGRKGVNLESIRSMLQSNGFELIEDRNAKLIEQVKIAVIRLVQRDHEREPLRGTLSTYISGAVGREYHSLSVLFSSIEHVTIEHYFILQRIERAKELLKDGELSLKEIAFRMGYSSVQHLSNQFKQQTGLTPGHFRTHGHHSRLPIDKVLPPRAAGRH